MFMHSNYRKKSTFSDMIRSHFFSNHTIDLLLHQMIKTTTFIIFFIPSSVHPHPYLTTAPPAPYKKEEKLITDISLKDNLL